MALSRYAIAGWLGLVVLGVALYRCEGGSVVIPERGDLVDQDSQSPDPPSRANAVKGDVAIDAASGTLRRTLIGSKTRTSPIAGTVIYRGAPVEGAVVSCTAIGVRGSKTFGRTNELGRFTLVVGQSFKYRLRAESGDRRGILEPVTAGHTVQITLEPHHRIRFHLVDSLGEAVVGARVLFLHGKKIVAAPVSGREIEDVVLPAGRISIIVRGSKVTKGSSERNVMGSAAVWRIVVEAFGSCRLTGRVLSGGKPVEGAQVSFHRPQRAVTTDRNGSFEIRGLDQGSKCMWVDHPDFAPHGDWVQVSPSDSKSVIVELRQGRILQVMCLTNRAIPVEGAVVRVVRALQIGDVSTGPPEHRVFYRYGITGKSGRVAIRGCSPGRVRVVAQHAECGTGQEEAVTYNDVSLTLAPARRILLRLSGLDRHGLDRAWDATVAPARPIDGMSREIMFAVRFDTRGIAYCEIGESVKTLGVQLRGNNGLWWSYSEVRVDDVIALQSPGTRLLVNGLTRDEVVSFESDGNYRGKARRYDPQRRRAECWLVPGHRYTVTVQGGTKKTSREVFVPAGAKEYVVSWR